MKFQKGRQSIRLRDFDYAAEQAYFITMICRNRERFFGEIEDEQVILSPAGEVVDKQWMETSTVRPEITIDCFVVMPNHTHAIIVIGKPALTQESGGRITGGKWTHVEWKAGSRTLGSFVGGFKSACSSIIQKEIDPAFGWHRNYHDHIIRDQAQLENIRGYIRDNPRNWKEDDLFR